MTRAAQPPAHRQVLTAVAERIVRLGGHGVRRVAIDGVDGAGKTTFADDLATALTAAGEEVVWVSVDGFHNPRAVRYRRGRSDPAGFFADSYDYAALRRELLDPLAPGGDRRVRRAVHDVVTDAAVDSPVEVAPEGSVLVLDGIFLHREELAGIWDLSVYLDVSRATACARMAQRDGSPPDPEHPANRRYTEGQRIYLHTCTPAQRATIVIDYDDLSAPRIVLDPHVTGGPTMQDARR